MENPKEESEEEKVLLIPYEDAGGDNAPSVEEVIEYLEWLRGKYGKA